MVSAPSILRAKVMHSRLFPKRNAFSYGVYYFVLPLPAAAAGNRLCRFDARDLGRRDGEDPSIWAREILATYGLNDLVADIVLVTMPRVLGYVFNPVSFYLCHDRDGGLRAVLCEVHNTFGQQHSYLCARPDRTPIQADEWLDADKVFHVSPFLERTGSYRFRFDIKDGAMGIWIDYADADGKKQLATSLIGQLSPLTPRNVRHAFWSCPAVTLKAITLIHWQALKLLFKGIRYIPKPLQLEPKVTATRNLNKN